MPLKFGCPLNLKSETNQSRDKRSRISKILNKNIPVKVLTWLAAWFGTKRALRHIWGVYDNKEPLI